MKKTNSTPPPKLTKHFAARSMAAPRTIDNCDDSPSRLPQPQRMIDKVELLKRVPVTFPTIWKWMIAGDFPRSQHWR
jgi:hypothetical protein